MTKHRAIIETSGAGVLQGVWVQDQPDGSPDVAFVEELGQLDAEKLLGEAAELGADWGEFMTHLADRQNHITVLRYAGTTELDAPTLLAAAKAALEDGAPLLGLLT